MAQVLPFRRVLGFGALPVLGALAPMLVWPVVARVGGPAIWSGLAVAQAIGVFAASCVLYGWGVFGPPRVAKSAPEDRGKIYEESWATRTTLFLFVVPVACVWAAFTGVPGDLGTNLLMLVASALPGLSIGWYGVGLGKPSMVARYEAIPKIVAMVVSVVCMAVTGSVVWYPLLLAVATAMGLRTFHRKHSFPLVVTTRASGALARSLRAGWSAAALSITGSLYGNSPVPLAGVMLDPGGLGTLASADRVYRYGFFSIGSLANGLQEWVNGSPRHELQGRRRAAVAAHAFVGALGAMILAWLGPPASELLFGAGVRASYWATGAYGVAFLALSLSTAVITYYFVPSGRQTFVFTSTASAAFTGMVVMVLLGRLTGGDGIATGYAVSEAVNLLILLVTGLLIRSKASQVHLEDRRGT